MIMLTSLFLVFIATGTFPGPEGARYLVITHDDFYEAILPLVEWKQKKGMKTRVVKLSEIDTTVSAIKDYVQDAYDNWNPRPEYLLLVGDVEFLPTYYGGEMPTDNYYATLEGNDSLSDICVGRFSVDNAFECSTMVAKTLGYERSPWIMDHKWFRSAILLVRDDYDEDDSIWYYPDTWLAYDLLAQHGYVHIDTLFRRNGVDASDIMRCVNNGCGLIGFRGCAGWDWIPPFQVWPGELDNGWKLPVIFSGTCLTGAFQEDGFACEGWTRAGTPGEPKGAVAYVATNTVTGPGPRSVIWKGFWEAIFRDSIFVLGDALVEAKLCLDRSSWVSRCEYEGWNIVGDPELNLWTDTPKALDVTCLHAIPIGASDFVVSVSSSGVPVEHALVCLLKKDEVYEYGHTNVHGDIDLAVNPITADTMWVTVTGHNYEPHEGQTVVVSGGAYIHLLKYAIVDTGGTGNGNMIPNPGEEIEMPLWVRNYGAVDAIGVSGVLSTTDPFVAVSYDNEYFGSIRASDSVVTAHAYEFAVAINCPDRHKILFKLSCNDTADSTWLSWFDVTVSSPVVTCSARVVDDAGQADPNGAIDPGETVRLSMYLGNGGSALARGVSAVLHSDDSYVTINDSVATYGDIPPDSVRNNSSNPFVVTCSPSTPVYHRITFTLRVTSTSKYETTAEFTLKAGLGGDYVVWDPAYDHKNGPILDSLLVQKGYIGDYTTELSKFLPYLSRYTSAFVCLGVPHYDYTLTPGPAVDALVLFLQSGGRIYMEGANTWVNDQATKLHEYFQVIPQIEGYPDIDSLLGVSGTITDGMRFDYVGEDRSIDRIKAKKEAWAIFENSFPTYTSGVAFTDGYHSYKTIATNFELGGLSDGVSTRATLVDSIMQWFLRDPVNDVAIWEVENPEYLVVQPDTPLQPSAMVKNLGASDVSVGLICRIDSSGQRIYEDTGSLFLAPRDSGSISFDSWVPYSEGNVYDMRFWTELPNDGERQNNVRSKEVTSFDVSRRRVVSNHTLVRPVIDGYIDTTYEWLDASRLDISDILNRTGSGPFPANSAILYIMHDADCIYFGFNVRCDKSLRCSDGFVLCLDDNRDRSYPFYPDSSEGELRYRYYGAHMQIIDYMPVTCDNGGLGRYRVEMQGMSCSNWETGGAQHEFALPLGSLPAQLDVLAPDTVGFAVMVRSYDQAEYYAWWPHEATSIDSPVSMGKLVIGLLNVAQIGINPRMFRLGESKPNPSTGATTILYQLPGRSDVSMRVYDMAGRLVRILAEGIEEAGHKKVDWDGKDDMDRCVAAGIYLCRFKATAIEGEKSFEKTRKVIFLGRR